MQRIKRNEENDGTTNKINNNFIALQVEE